MSKITKENTKFYTTRKFNTQEISVSFRTPKRQTITDASVEALNTGIKHGKCPLEKLAEEYKKLSEKIKK